jgi:hypothetical protein
VLRFAIRDGDRDAAGFSRVTSSWREAIANDQRRSFDLGELFFYLSMIAALGVVFVFDDGFAATALFAFCIVYTYFVSRRGSAK